MDKSTLDKHCCDQTLRETARPFGLGSYGAVGWCCYGVQTKKEKGFRDQIERLVREFCQQKTSSLSSDPSLKSGGSLK
jgi:hypothetical protein